MILTEVLADARMLPRHEQMQLLEELAAKLTRDEATALIEPGRAFPVWSPDAAYGAADILLKSLGDNGQR